MRLHLTKNGPGFEDGEIVVTDQDNGWLVSTFKTCEVSAEEHDALMRGLVHSYNACEDALAEYNKHVGDGTGHMPCPTARRMADILRRAINGEG